jgi:enoyl-CoA hydratase
MIRVDRDGRVAVVTMEDPDRYNALSTPMVDGLRDAFARLRDDRSVRAIVLTGAGKGFCSGANLAGGDAPPPMAADRGPVGRVHFAQEHLAELILAIAEARQPVIAAVSGAAVGGGLALALACDLRVTSPDAFFSCQFVRVGMSSCDVGTSYTLPRIVGPTVAADLMLTGRRFSAEEALRLGVVNRVVAREELMSAAVALGEEIAANSEYGVYLTKIGLRANLDAPSLRHAIELENRTQVLATFTGNMTEAGKAFVEGRTPEWRPM